MKLMITWSRKNGTCRSWTNSEPCKHVRMSLCAWSDAIKRLGEEWGCTPEEAAEQIKQIYEQETKK